MNRVETIKEICHMATKSFAMCRICEPHILRYSDDFPYGQYKSSETLQGMLDRMSDESLLDFKKNFNNITLACKDFNQFIEALANRGYLKSEPLIINNHLRVGMFSYLSYVYDGLCLGGGVNDDPAKCAHCTGIKNLLTYCPDDKWTALAYLSIATKLCADEPLFRDMLLERNTHLLEFFGLKYEDLDIIRYGSPVLCGDEMRAKLRNVPDVITISKEYVGVGNHYILLPTPELAEVALLILLYITDAEPDNVWSGMVYDKQHALIVDVKRYVTMMN